MNRLMLRTLALLALVCAFVVPVQAGPHWFSKEVKWRVSRFGSGSSTTPFRGDTAFTVIGDGTAAPDTSQWFVLDGLWEPKGGYSAIADSIIVGYVVLVSDTTAVYTAALTSITTAFDASWYSLASPAAGTATILSDQAVSSTISGGNAKLVTTANKVVAIPITFGQMLPNSINTNVGLLQFAPLRFRISSATGHFASARIFVAYQRDEAQK